MANFEVAEQGKYFSPHDAKLGGVLCNSCHQTLTWHEQSNTEDKIFESLCCQKRFFLKESLNNKLLILS